MCIQRFLRRLRHKSYINLLAGCYYRIPKIFFPKNYFVFRKSFLFSEKLFFIIFWIDFRKTEKIFGKWFFGVRNKSFSEFGNNFLLITVKFCGLSPVKLPNYSAAVPPKKILFRILIFFYFQIKMFCHFQGKFTIWPRVLVANDTFQHDLPPLIELKSVIFWENFPT